MCHSGTCEESTQILSTKGATTMKITTIGLDLAKNVFQVHGAHSIKVSAICGWMRKVGSRLPSGRQAAGV
jgi:hypothetical protein